MTGAPGGHSGMVRVSFGRLSLGRIGLLDLTPLRTSAPFRRLWFGGAAGALAHQFVTVAVLFQVWDLTRNPLWTGMVGLATAVPMILAALIGGSLADALDRRTIVRVAAYCQVLVAVGFVTQAALDLDSMAVVIVLVALAATTAGFGAPARRSLMTRLLPRPLVPAGVALHLFSFQSTMLIGPALAGIVIARWDVTAAYAVQLLVAPIMLYAVIRLPRLAHEGSPTRAGIGSFVDGLRYVVRAPVVRGSFGVDLFATLLVTPIALFPMINDLRFDGNPQTLGLFFSAVAVGGILAGLFSGAITRIDRVGVVQLSAAAAWCVALAGFGLAGQVWLVLGALMVAGAADTISVIARGGLVQVAVPDSHRGRVFALDHVVGAGGPHLGNARAGVVASLTSAPVALVSGGLLALAGIGWIAWRNTSLRRVRFSDLRQTATEPTASASATAPSPPTPPVNSAE